MAQVRSALRAYARYEPDPAVVLDQLDALVSALEITELVTCLYGTLSDPDADGTRVLRWSNAGHLPPLLLRAEGSFAVLDDAGSLVIGTPLEIVRPSAEIAIPSGSTVVLFTDGLVEVPGTALDGAVERLAEALVASRASTADALCEVALGTLVPHERRDDIALLAVTNTAVGATAAPHDRSVDPVAARRRAEADSQRR
jgi:serine phosphatase RsbU (regulator of sigma subunit)